MINIKTTLENKLGKDQAQFIKHSKNYLIGNFATKALAFISIPVFTRLLLPNEYGLLAIVSSITQIFTILMLLNFHGALSRNYHEKDGEFSVFVGSITVFLFLYNIIFITFIYIFKNSFAGFFNISPKLFIFGIINGFLGIFTTLYLSYLQTSQQSKKYAILSLVKSFSILVIAIGWVFYLKENKYLGRIYSEMVINGFLFAYSLYNIIKISIFKVDRAKIKYAINFGAPLIFHAMSGFILVQFDRIIINQISGPGDAGLYSFAYNIGMIMNVVVMSLNKSWVPIFYSKLKDNKYEDINKMVLNYTKFILLSALILILFSREIVIFIADSAYYSALSLVPIIILSYVFVYFYTIYANYSFYRKKTYLISINTVIAGVTNVILNYIFIPKFGYMAGAYTTLFSYALLFSLHYLNSRYILKEKVPRLSSNLLSVLIFSTLIVLYKLIESYDIVGFVGIMIKLVFIGIFIIYILKSYRKEQ